MRHAPRSFDRFNNAQAFNNGDTGNNGLKPLNGWDTSKVTDMVSMFNSANAFNQDISNWKTGMYLNSPDVHSPALILTRATCSPGEVTGMNGMFSAAIVFNNGDTGNSQLKPLNGWDTSKVTDMNNM